MKISKRLMLEIITPVASGVLCWIGGSLYSRHKILKQKKVDLVLDGNGNVYLAFQDQKTYDQIKTMKCVVCNVVKSK